MAHKVIMLQRSELLSDRTYRYAVIVTLCNTPNPYSILEPIIWIVLSVRVLFRLLLTGVPLPLGSLNRALIGELLIICIYIYMYMYVSQALGPLTQELGRLTRPMFHGKLIRMAT